MGAALMALVINFYFLHFMMSSIFFSVLLSSELLLVLALPSVTAAQSLGLGGRMCLRACVCAHMRGCVWTVYLSVSLSVCLSVEVCLRLKA